MKFEKIKHNLVFIKDEENLFKYDLRDGSFYKTTNGKERKVKHPQQFFRGYDYSGVSDLMSETHEELVKIIKKENPLISNVGTFLKLFKDFQNVEAWIYLGINRQNFKQIYKQASPKDLGKRGLSLLKDIKNVSGDKLKYSTDDWRCLNQDYLTETVIKNCSTLKNKNIFFTYLDYVEEMEYFKNKYFAIDYFRKNGYNIIKCIKDYNCNLNTLLDYMIIKIENMENYGNYAWSDYIDFLNMQYKLIGKLKEKYPKFLKSNHDIMTRVYNDYKKEHREDIFLTSLDRNLECKKILNKQYQIVLPSCTQDLKDEGLNLGHCVASYIESIMEGKRQVVFLRNVENLEESLLTLDISKGKINQCEGKSRRSPNKDERKALSQYAKLKKLKEEY